ncbi:hypothetical protein SeLEV6574_g08175 [Synchytrium endobioticum]|uniref:B9 domain-containing protein 2 n=1 Tax=Synchytrium endobioticum TaxID=286115 RepID=A0A507C8E6_9FUNG|nr:hypothetical protein SeLEV6574_g08175 [Synchytrium endobioticum]
MVAGEGWRLLEGDESGQTHVDIPADRKNTVWSHPIDVHYATKTVQGWPKLHFQVFYQDPAGLNQLYGYGFIHVPTSPGVHEVEVQTWRPLGTLSEQIWSYFTGCSTHLKNLHVVYTPTDRFRLSTATMGKVHLELGVILRNFETYGVSL